MTFDDDHVQLRLATGQLRMTCKSLGLDWPPPERIAIVGGLFESPYFRRIRFSQITDDERAGMTRVIRGAEYVHED